MDDLDLQFIKLHKLQTVAVGLILLISALHIGWNFMLSHQVKQLWKANAELAQQNLDLLTNDAELVRQTNCNRALMLSLWAFVEEGENATPTDGCKF